MIKSVEIPLYGGRIHIVFTEDIEKDVDLINTKFSKALDKKKLDFAAVTQSRKNHYLVIINIKNIPKKDFEAEIVNTITHETTHIFSFISKRVNIYPDVDNDEAQAYLSGWISCEIYKVYLNFKKEQYDKINSK